MPETKITTSKMPKETEQQYAAWLLYCEAGSLRKTLEAWDRLGQDWGETGAVFAARLGKKPVETTIETWSAKFHWVERREMKLTEDLMALREKTKKIKRDKLHRIAEAFDRVSSKVLKRLRGNEEPSVLEWKMIWEMFQVEIGKPTSRSQLKVNEDQRPLTPQEKEYGKQLHDAVDAFIQQEHKRKK